MGDDRNLGSYWDRTDLDQWDFDEDGIASDDYNHIEGLVETAGLSLPETDRYEIIQRYGSLVHTNARCTCGLSHGVIVTSARCAATR